MSQTIKTIRKFTCLVCGKEFSPAYRLSRHRDLNHCSKTCAGKIKDGGFHRKSDLEKKVVDLLIKCGRYMTMEEILDGLKISSKTLTAFGVSTLACNKLAGFKKPARIFENRVLSVLVSKYAVETEVEFDGCLSPKGYPLRIDFFVPSLNMAIEADGSQHDSKHPWHKPYHSECDKIKNDFFLKNGIQLFRIPYTKRVTAKYVFNILETKVATT